MIWITVPAGPFLSHFSGNKESVIFLGKKCDFYGKKNGDFMETKISTQENGILNRQRKRRAKPGELKQKKKRLQKNEHFVCGRLQI